MRLRDYPLIKFTSVFVFGIIFAEVFSVKPEFVLLTFSIAFLLTLILYFTKKFTAANVFAFLAIFLFGSALNSIEKAKISQLQYPFEKELFKRAAIYGKITNAEIPLEDKLRFEIECDSVKTRDLILRNKFNALVNVYFKKRNNAEAKKFNIGDYVEINGRLFKPRGKRNPCEFDYAKYLKEKGIVALVSVNEIGKVKILRKGGTSFESIIYNLRLKINDAINRLYGRQKRALIKALILGERRDIEKSTVNNFINSGTVHVLAVSGLHVGFIALILLVLLGRFGIFLRSALTALGLVSFILISGAHPSVIRAGVMALVLLIAFLSGRDYSPLNALFFAALIILIINPRELFDPGFQLSFSAVLSILIFYPVFNGFIRRWIHGKYAKKFAQFLAVSVAAQIGSLPFTLIYFHKLSLVSVLANIFAIPLIGIIVSLAFASLIFSAVSLQFASLYAITNALAIDALFKIAEISSKVNYAYFDVAKFGTANAIVYFIAVAIFFYTLVRFRFRARVVVFLLLVLNFAIYSKLLEREILPRNALSVIAIDVGQGDALLVKFPDNEAILIDAGNATKRFDNGANVILPLLDYLNIDTLRALFISHVDADHYRGSFAIVKSGRVKTIYKPRLDKNMKKDLAFEDFLNKRKRKINYYQRKAINIGGCRVYILNDTTAAAYQHFDNNNRSGLLKIVYGKNSILFTGDLEKEGERFYINSYGEFLRSDLLKAGHHGSKTSSSEEFIATVKPKFAIISAGKFNKFGHPNFEVLERLNKFKVKIKRTDKSGAVIFTANGENIDIINWK